MAMVWRAVMGAVMVSGTVLAASAARAAGDGAGGYWYGAAGATLSLLNDAHNAIANAPVPGSTVSTLDPMQAGYGGQISLGRSFGTFRLEGELGFSRNTQDHYISIVPPTGTIHADVKNDIFRYMVNGYYDFDAGRLQPYLGAGLGGASISIDFFAPRAPFPTEAPRQLIKDTQNQFAYQLMAGVALPLDDRWTLTAQYRWFDAGNYSGQDTRGQPIETSFSGHNLDFGIRLRF